MLNDEIILGLKDTVKHTDVNWCKSVQVVIVKQILASGHSEKLYKTLC